MAIFPFNQAQSNDEIIRHTCKLYRLSLLTVFPLSLLIVIIYHFIFFSHNYIPPRFAASFQHLMMFIAILLVPLFSMMISLILDIGEGKKASYLKALKISLKKFISVMGCLISMSLLPVIVLAVGIVSYFLVGHFFPGLPPFLFFVLKVLIVLAVFLAILTKITAPILLFSENKDVNSAIDIAEQSMKIVFARTFLFTLYGFALLWFIAIIPSLFQYYFKANAIQPMILEGIAELGLVFILPWVVSLLIVESKDLFLRWEGNSKKEEKQKVNVALKTKTREDKNISF